MKKVISLALFVTGMFAGTIAFAQNAEATLATPDKTQQVVESIPTLKSIALEIARFEAKAGSKKENPETTKADLRTLKLKYAAELKTQMVANKNNKETYDILSAELKKTQAELSKMK